MKNLKENRREFLRTSFVSTGGLMLSILPANANPVLVQEDSINIVGPKEGYSPQIGTLVSMMTWMRTATMYPVKGLTKEQLDYLHDDNANSIGSMLLHLAATERFYQIHTFENKKWGDWNEKDVDRFDVAMKLGSEGRKSIKGNELSYYTDTLEEIRSNTLSEFRKRDDKWLMQVDKEWFWGPTNNYCKWFHVCEHESNHNGQIKWIKGRLPGTKAGND